MVLLGTIVNALAIVAGGLVGSTLNRIPPGIKNTVMQGLGLAVLVLGIQYALLGDNILLVITSLVVGGIIGEMIRIEYRLNQMGTWLESKMKSNGEQSISKAFVTTTLVYCIGAMAVLGSLASGMSLDHEILYTKAMLDGFSAIIFASTLGIGVIFSAVPVFIYQGLIALSAKGISAAFDEKTLDLIVNEMTATGGILIIGIALNVLELKKINVANLLPAIIIAAVGVPLLMWLK